MMVLTRRVTGLIVFRAEESVGVFQLSQCSFSMMSGGKCLAEAQVKHIYSSSALSAEKSVQIPNRGG